MQVSLRFFVSWFLCFGSLCFQFLFRFFVQIYPLFVALLIVHRKSLLRERLVVGWLLSELSKISAQKCQKPWAFVICFARNCCMLSLLGKKYKQKTFCFHNYYLLTILGFFCLALLLLSESWRKVLCVSWIWRKGFLFCLCASLLDQLGPTLSFFCCSTTTC